jgi:PAS domain S-box-containing protein
MPETIDHVVLTPAAAPHHPGLEALPDAFCMVDAQWRVTYWNAAAERLLGLARDEALDRPLWDVLPGAGAQRARLATAMEDGEPVRYLETLRNELLPRPVWVQAAPVEGGGIAVHLRDASEERYLAEQYSRLLESIRNGFVAVDPDWRIVYLNRTAQTLLSLRKHRALGVRLWDLLPAGPAALGRALRATMDDGQPRRLTAVQPEARVFEGRFFDVWTYPLAGGGISILFADVTDRLEREKELARLAAEAEEASRAKSRFFAAASHELRTPLNAIVGYTHLLATQTYGDVPASAVRASERACVCAEHLAHLVDDVLLLTTVEIDRLPVFKSPVALAEFLPAALQHLAQQAEAKRLDFRIEVPDGLPPVETDPERLRQMVTALVSNAIKFTPRGTVEVLARVVDGGGWMEVAVRDSGPGVPEAERERIFHPFEQLGEEARSDSLNRGTGLGLTIARQLARRLDGDIVVRAAPGGGAEFVLRLPVAA